MSCWLKGLKRARKNVPFLVLIKLRNPIPNEPLKRIFQLRMIEKVEGQIRKTNVASLACKGTDVI